MLPLVGYANRFSVSPGETIDFKVSSSAAATYQARLVRVICGDPNPAGPGIREESLPADFTGSYPSRQQDVHLGSYACTRDAPALHGLSLFTLIATIWPTMPNAGRQCIISKFDPASGAGFALFVDENGAIAACIGDGVEGESVVSVGKPLRRRVWYRVFAAIDTVAGILTVGQVPLSSVHGVDDTGTERTTTDVLRTRIDSAAPLLVAALGGTPVSGYFNGKIERPMVVAKVLEKNEVLETARRGTHPDAILCYDFSREMSTSRVIDTGPHALHAELVNLPTRAVTGSTWTGEEMCWRHCPEHYGAIHFHDDDLYDCNWEIDFSFTIPADMRSGVYAARLECNDAHDMIPFFVRPLRGRTQSRACVLFPTFTYIAYANHARGQTDEIYRSRAAQWGARPWTPDDHPDYGGSTYNDHRDGSGIGYSSRLRPMITMRSGYITFPEERAGSGLLHFAADTHLLAWLHAKGHDFDVITDEDLHAEGIDLIAPYNVVMTTTHSEYQTPETLTALSQYTAQGGRLMYLGGNGFYWRIAVNPELPGAIEVRRAEGGIRAWAAEPGEYYHAFDGGYGGLWRRNARPPQGLVGVGFSAQGTFEGSYYRRRPEASDPRVDWIFEGVDENILGDFGLSGRGAAGFELDRADERLGTPTHAIVVASSEGHSERFILVPEEMLTHRRNWAGEPNERLIRADMVYFETPAGGAVFSVGSISFCGSLPHHDFDNNVSRILDNVLRRFAE